MSIKLTLTKEQAQTVSIACEFYARIKLGQFKEIIWHTLDPKLVTDDFCERRDITEHYLLEARKEIYPELHGIGHSYGIGKFEDADKSYDVHQVIRQLFGDERGLFSYYELPGCRKVNSLVELILSDEHARIISNACEFYARIKIGQFGEIIGVTLDDSLPIEEYCSRRDKAEHFLLEARKFIYPELHGIGHSYGIRKFEDAMLAYGSHQAIQQVFGDDVSLLDSQFVPKCEKTE